MSRFWGRSRRCACLGSCAPMRQRRWMGDGRCCAVMRGGSRCGGWRRVGGRLSPRSVEQGLRLFGASPSGPPQLGTAWVRGGSRPSPRCARPRAPTASVPGRRAVPALPALKDTRFYGRGFSEAACVTTPSLFSATWSALRATSRQRRRAAAGVCVFRWSRRTYHHHPSHLPHHPHRRYPAPPSQSTPPRPWCGTSSIPSV
mmetsp:Transcript_4749/g.8630  ORF Transcript_4749/g.8630 Transcript_4749/m.8630 type:complete len:201 (-) Transcript_4749:2259-2861(-)